MANDQTTIPITLRPLNIVAASQPFAGASSSFLDHTSNSNGSPTTTITTTSASFFYPTTVSNSSATARGVPNYNRIGGCNADEADVTSSSNTKVKILCSFGGKILPRPSDGVLRYAGGHTRIISIRRDISFPDLLGKMMDAYGHPVIIKYQLPEEDLDALVSVSCPEDLDNMMDEYGKLAQASDGSPKLRVFLFSASDLDPMPFTDLHDSGQRYVDAVNGVLDSTLTRRASTASATSTHNSDSLVSGPDGFDNSLPAHGDGGGLSSSPAMLSPKVSPAASLDDTTTRLAYVGPNPVIYAENHIATLGHTTAVGVPSQTLSSALPESELQGPVHAVGQHQSLGYDFHQPSGMNFTSKAAYTQAYVNLHHEVSSPVDSPHFPPQIRYINPQTYGRAKPFYTYIDYHLQQIQDNAGGFPPHQFIPAMHMTMASSTSNDNIRPSGPQQFMQPHQPWVNSYPEDSSFGTRVVQIPSENIHNVHELQTPALQAPIQLQARAYDRLQVPSSEHIIFSDGGASSKQNTPPEKTIKLEDCYMCQKVLPHAHSDTLVQDQNDRLLNDVSNSNPVFHSLCSEDISKVRALRKVIVSGAMVESAIEHQGTKAQPNVIGHSDQNVAAPQVGVLGSGQSPEVQHDCVNIVVPKREKDDHPRMCSPSWIGLAGDVVLPYGLHLGKIVQPHQDGALPQLPNSFQCQVKHDSNLSNQLVSTSTHTTIVPFQSVVTQVHDSSAENFVDLPALALREDISNTCISYDHLRPIDGRMEAVYINPPEISDNNEQYNLPSNQIRQDEIWDSRSQMMGKEAYLTNAFYNPGAAPGENHLELVKPVEAPASSSGLVYLHDIQPVESFQTTQPATLGISGPYTHLDIAVQHTNSGMWNDKRPYSGVVSAYATDRISPVWERRDDDPQFHSRIVSNLESVPWNGNSTSALSAPTGIVGDDKDLVPSNSLFSNHDPCALPHGTRFPPPRPNRVLMGKEAFVKGDEAVLQQLFTNLQKDLRLEHEGYTNEDHIKQELQAVAEGVAASVLDLNEPIPKANQNGESHNDSAEVQSTAEVENVKTKILDKTSPGLPISDGIGRLQIIKNGDLEELRELGSGTFGTVYHGKWRGTDVAIKRINNRCFAGKPSEQDRMRDDFWNEAIKLADLHHPNVVAFYGVVLDGPGGSVATVTEYMVNGSLRQAIQRDDRTLDKRKCVLIAMDVAFGMEYLHGKNIVHFDLKSDNLLVNLRDPHRPICKVGDLGLSKVKCQTLISGGVQGTLPWMAPELLNGGSNLVSEKVDVFSFGIVMWELLTGEEPYADLHYGAIIGGIVSNTLRPTVGESCDPEWRCLMERCWCAEPSDRPNFTEIANQLRSMAASRK